MTEYMAVLLVYDTKNHSKKSVWNYTWLRVWHKMWVHFFWQKGQKKGVWHKSVWHKMYDLKSLVRMKEISSFLVKNSVSKQYLIRVYFMSKLVLFSQSFISPYMGGKINVVDDLTRVRFSNFNNAGITTISSSTAFILPMVSVLFLALAPAN